MCYHISRLSLLRGNRHQLALHQEDVQGSRADRRPRLAGRVETRPLSPAQLTLGGEAQGGEHLQVMPGIARVQHEVLRRQP